MPNKTTNTAIIQLDPEIMKAVNDLGFSEWTDIQLKTIPLIQKGHDVIGQSYTGSGKTAAFGLPILEKIIRGKGIQTLIIAPTRELSEQISKEMIKFAKYKRINVLPIYGGVAIGPQIDKLRFADIIIGTPGRLLDHIDRRTMDLRNVKIVVLDEADRMLDMGFIDDIRKIFTYIPQTRQTLLFSATIPSEIQDIVRRFMKNPEKIKVQTYVDEGKLSQYYYNVDANDKFSLLVDLLKKDKGALSIIFCSTRHMVDILSRNLHGQGVKAEALHGGLTQMRRQKAIDLFHQKRVDVLVASDVAARGLDIKNVNYVINFDLPKNSKEYIHRIGRTARAGTEGKVISIVSPPDYDNFRSVLSDRSLNIEKLQAPVFPKLVMQRNEGSRRNAGPEYRSTGQGHKSFRSGADAPPRRFEARRNFAQRKGFGGRR